MPRVRTYTGRLVDLETDALDKHEIAHGLARVHRCCGQTPRAMTVAEHSFWVALKVLAKTKDHKKALAGLLHDASEALMCDIPQPLKCCLPDYKRLESIFQGNIYTAHGVEEVPEEVKEADEEQWREEYEVHFSKDLYGGNLFILPCNEAENLWLQAYGRLQRSQDIHSLVPIFFNGIWVIYLLGSFVVISYSRLVRSDKLTLTEVYIKEFEGLLEYLDKQEDSVFLRLQKEAVLSQLAGLREDLKEELKENE